MYNILIKLSGEYLELFNENKIDNIIQQIKQLIQHKYKISIVIGGGNIIRSKNFKSKLLKDYQIDICGMQGTKLNGMILNFALQNAGFKSQIVNDFEFDLNKINLFTQGINNPYFSTDMASVVKGKIISADIIIKATNVDGLYTADPNTDSSAKKITKLSFKEYIESNLQCIDINAIQFAKAHNLKIQITSIQNLFNNIHNKNGSFLCN